MTSSELSLAIKKRPQDITFERCMICMTASYFIYIAPFLQGGVFKVLASFLLILSEIFAISTINILYKKGFFRFSKTQWGVLGLLLVYNLFLIVEGFFSPECNTLSFLGNVNFQPAFMLPFFILIGTDLLLIRILFKYIKIYCCSIILAIPLGGDFMVGCGILLFYLISFSRFYNRKMVFIIIVVSILYIYYCWIADARTPVIRTVIAFLILLYSYFHQIIKTWLKKLLAMLVILLPLYFFYLFSVTGDSVFNAALGDNGGEHSVDTRTLLYEEVLLDVITYNAVLTGKGINGHYYSNYFASAQGDSEDRKNPEVGILSMLLKGGLVLCVLSLLILSMAIYQSFIKSDFMMMNVIGALLMMHYLILFFEHIPQYGMLYMPFQFLIGTSLVNSRVNLSKEQLLLLF